MRKGDKVQKNKVIILITAVFFIFSISSCVKENSPNNTPQSEKAEIIEQSNVFAGIDAASDFSLPTLKGETLRLSSFKGKVIILNFWATWCPPCRAEIPDFIKLYNEYRNKGLVIIGLNVDTGDVDKVRNFCEKMEISYPIVLSNNEIKEAYGGIKYIPTTFIINRDGKIAKKYMGYTDFKVFETDILRLL